MFETLNLSAPTEGREAKKDPLGGISRTTPQTPPHASHPSSTRPRAPPCSRSPVHCDWTSDPTEKAPLRAASCTALALTRQTLGRATTEQRRGSTSQTKLRPTSGRPLCCYPPTLVERSPLSPKTNEIPSPNGEADPSFLRPTATRLIYCGTARDVPGTPARLVRFAA